MVGRCDFESRGTRAWVLLERFWIWIFGFWFFPDDGYDDVVEEWMDGSNAMDGRLTIVDCVCFVFVAESKTLVKQHAFHMKRATVSNLKTTTRLDTR